MCTERLTTILQEKIINTSGIQKHLEPITGCCKTFEAILHSKCAAENVRDRVEAEKDSWHVKMLKSITNKENLRINGGSNKKVKKELLLVEKLHGKKFNHQNPCAFVALFFAFLHCKQI